jgi:hypothetical protein
MGLLDLIVGKLLGGLLSHAEDASKLQQAVHDELLRLQGLSLPPDALVAQMAAFIESHLSPHIDTSKLLATIQGVAADLVHGTSGVDPDAWSGSV